MALTNPKYARQSLLGGFNPAQSDTWPQPMFVPPNPAAMAEGAGMGDSNYSEDPAGAVQNRFSASLSATTPGGEEEAIPPIPPDQAVPMPLTSNDIAQTFAPLLQEIEGQTSPPGRPIPPPTPALATFLSVLAGSLSAHLTKDPRIHQSVLQTLEQNQQRRQAIEDQNYANDLLFNQQKATRRLAAMGQQIETQLDAAIKANDTDRQMALMKNLENLKAMLGDRATMVQGREDRKTLKTKAALETETTTAGAESKPLEPKDYLARIEAIAGNKNIPDRGTDKFLGLFPVGEKVTSKENEIGQIYAAGVLAGNPETKRIAKRHAWFWALRKTKLEKKAIDNWTDADVSKVEEALKTINLTIEDVSDAGSEGATNGSNAQ